MVKKSIIMIGLTISTFFSDIYSKKVIVWDLHGVLIEHSKWSMADHLGKMNCFWYSGDLSKRFNEFLALFEPYGSSTSTVTLKGQSQPMPKFMAEWQKGNLSSKDTVAKLKELIEKEKKFFKSDLEKQLITGICEAMLPEKLSKVVNPVNEMVKVVEHYKANMPKENRMIVLSNWDKESFDLMKRDKKFQRLFNCFDEKDIIISGQIKKVKPDKDIFDHVLNHCGVKAQDCTFIDDQIANVESAKKNGFDVIHHTDPTTTKKALAQKDLFAKKEIDKPKVDSKKTPFDTK